VRSSLHAPHSLASMAEQAAVSPRTLQRQFLVSPGLSPADWLAAERVALARSLLAAPDFALSELCTRTGFGSEKSLRRHFHRLVGVSPGRYRKALLLAGRATQTGEQADVTQGNTASSCPA
jgi:AraC family transcriptional activator FtrA